MNPSLASLGDIEIRIESLHSKGYPIKLSSKEQDFAGYSPAGMPELHRKSADEDGKILFDWLFHDPALREGWGRLKGKYPDQRAVRLWIDDEAVELHQFPWELLIDGYSPIAASDETPFSRFLTTSRIAPRPALRPVKVLVAVAAPQGLEDFGLAPIDIEKEVSTLASVLQVPGVVQMTVLDQPCTLDALNKMLTRDFHVLHLVAHGTFSQETGESAIFLADDQNRRTLVKENDFVGMFERHIGGATFIHERNLRLVYLSSCLQAKRSSATAFSGIGAKLVEAGVPSVIAMQELLEMQLGQQFAAEFYRNLFNEGRVDLACNRARSSVMARAQYGSASISDTVDTGLRRSAIPVLFMHRKDGWLWDRAGFADRETGEWNQLETRMGQDSYTLILGPDFNRVLIGSRSEIAYDWARAYGFPMTPERQRDLPQVAQFLAVNQGRAFPRNLLREHIRKELERLYRDDLLGDGGRAPSQASVDDLIIRAGLGRQKRDEYEPYHLVATLPISVFMTVNESSLLVESLRAVRKDPVVAFAPWNKNAEKLPQCFINAQKARANDAADTERTNTPSAYPIYQGEKPSVERPVVYYLFGHLCDPETLVLTEDDYFDYLIAASSKREIVHPTIRKHFTDSGLMFLGFQLEDWAFRVLFRSIVQQAGSYMLGNYQHVAAQVNPELTEIESVENAKRYLNTYFGERHHVSVYWGSVESFLTELVQRLPARG